jgi:hypothetical protein
MLSKLKAKVQQTLKKSSATSKGIDHTLIVPTSSRVLTVGHGKHGKQLVFAEQLYVKVAVAATEQSPPDTNKDEQVYAQSPRLSSLQQRGGGASAMVGLLIESELCTFSRILAGPFPILF